MIRILEYGKLTNQEIFARIIPQTHVEGVVTEIIQTVRKEGDSALYAYAQKFDGAQLDTLAVTDAEMEEAPILDASLSSFISCSHASSSARKLFAWG